MTDGDNNSFCFVGLLQILIQQMSKVLQTSVWYTVGTICMFAVIIFINFYYCMLKGNSCHTGQRQGSPPGRKVKQQAVEKTATGEAPRTIYGVDPVDTVNRFWLSSCLLNSSERMVLIEANTALSRPHCEVTIVHLWSLPPTPRPAPHPPSRWPNLAGASTALSKSWLAATGSSTPGGVFWLLPWGRI